MKLNYKRLGQYIRAVDVRNSDGKEDNLLGVSVQKVFMPSIANTVGTDFTKYKVVKRGQFTYIPDTSRRGDKIGIALLEDYEEGLVSNVYTVFEIIDEKQLIPQYLMLWFSRPEFDRYARFKSHGSVREVFDWDELCKVELPVPPYEEQLEIVNSYRAITERIALKKWINDNLAEQCSCVLYNQYASDIDNGYDWTKYTVQELIDMQYIEPPMDGNHGEIHPKVSDYVSVGVPFIMANNLSDGFVDLTQCAYITEKQAKSLRKGFARPNDVLLTHKATLGRVAIVPEGYDYIILTPQVTYYRVLKKISSVYLKYYFSSNYFQSILEAFAGGGSTRAYIGITKQCELPVYLPCKASMESITKSLEAIEDVRKINQAEILQLNEMRTALITQLSRR